MQWAPESQSEAKNVVAVHNLHVLGGGEHIPSVLLVVAELPVAVLEVWEESLEQEVDIIVDLLRGGCHRRWWWVVGWVVA